MSGWPRRTRFHEIAPGLWQGPLPADPRDVATLAGSGVTRILNLCEDREYEPGERERVVAALEREGIEEARLASLDHGSLLPGLLERAVRTVQAWREEGETVLVHCFAGIERSATVAAAILAAEHDEPPALALRRLRRVRRDARPLDHQVADLERWWASRSRADAEHG